MRFSEDGTYVPGHIKLINASAGSHDGYMVHYFIRICDLDTKIMDFKILSVVQYLLPSCNVVWSVVYILPKGIWQLFPVHLCDQLSCSQMIGRGNNQFTVLKLSMIIIMFHSYVFSTLLHGA